MNRPITYEELVQRTGIEFLPGIKPALGGGADSSPPPTQPGACGSKRTCKQMADCAEATHYLRNCGVTSLDGDGDGMPCEKLCR